jgi:hypothetical protein
MQISKNIILHICKYIGLKDMFNYRLSCKHINKIITQYLYKHKQFYITNNSIYYLANRNIQHIEMTKIFPNITHTFL